MHHFMESILSWLSAHHEVVGFITSALIFLITVVLVTRRLIGFSIALLFLLFSLISGLTIANQDFLREWLMKPKEVSSKISTEKREETESNSQ